MPEVDPLELRIDRFISHSPATGVLAVVDGGAVVQNLIAWSPVTGDVTHSAPAGTGTNTRRHLFDRPIESTSTAAFISMTGTLGTAAQPNITSVGTLVSPHMTGAVIDSGGLTVTAGSTSLQALTATTIFATTTITANGDGAFRTTNNSKVWQFGPNANGDWRVAHVGIITALALAHTTGNASFGGPTMVIDSTTSATHSIALGNVAVAGVSSGLYLRTGSAHRAWLVGANYSVADVLEFTASASIGALNFSFPAMTLSHLGNQDSDVTLLIGAGGAAPSAGRSVNLTLNAPHSGSFIGQAFIRYMRNGGVTWEVGIDSGTNNLAKGANTDLYWYAGGYRMALSVGGILAIENGINSKDYLGTFRGLVRHHASVYGVVIGDATAFDAGVSAIIFHCTAGSLPTGASTRDGMILVDGTNNRFVYYSGSARYYIAGTSF